MSLNYPVWSMPKSSHAAWSIAAMQCQAGALSVVGLLALPNIWTMDCVQAQQTALHIAALIDNAEATSALIFAKANIHLADTVCPLYFFDYISQSNLLCKSLAYRTIGQLCTWLHYTPILLWLYCCLKQRLIQLWKTRWFFSCFLHMLLSVKTAVNIVASGWQTPTWFD